MQTKKEIRLHYLYDTNPDPLNLPEDAPDLEAYLAGQINQHTAPDAPPIDPANLNLAEYIRGVLDAAKQRR